MADRCIRATKDNRGLIELAPAPYKAESWRKIQAEATRTERVEPLAGWGEWTALYRVEFAGGDWSYYAVSE
jgi:hypothetical protein